MRLALLLITLFCYGTVAAQYSYISASHRISPTSLSSVAFADIDGDNDQDLLVTGFDLWGNPIAELHKNSGTGRYSLVTNTPFEAVSESSIAFADIDNDNDQDVLITGYTGSRGISKLYVNDGGGNYTLVPNTPFKGVFSSSIAFADVDGDNDQDVLITGSFSSKLYANDGNGNYTLVPDTPFEGVRSSSVAFADVDGDNDQDLLITGATVSRKIAKLYTNDGRGNYTLVPNTPFVGVRSSSVAFADIDGDQDQDLLITGTPANDPSTNLT